MWRRFHPVASVASLQKKLSINTKGGNLHKHLSQNIPKQPIYVTNTMKPRLKTRKRLDMWEIRRKNCQRQNLQKHTYTYWYGQYNTNVEEPTAQKHECKKYKICKKSCTFSIFISHPQFFMPFPLWLSPSRSYSHSCWFTNSATRSQSVRMKNWGAKTTSWWGWFVTYLFQVCKKPPARLKKQTGLTLCQAHETSFSKPKQDHNQLQCD